MKTEILIVRVSPETKNRLKSRAKEYGLTMSEYVCRSIEGAAIKRASEANVYTEEKTIIPASHKVRVRTFTELEQYRVKHPGAGAKGAPGGGYVLTD